MPYVIKGHIRGWLCDDCEEPLRGTVVRFYAAAAEQAVERASAAPKDTISLRDEASSAGLAERLVGEATVAADGSYEATISERGYGGAALDVDLYCGSVPTSRPPKSPGGPIQLHITTIAPAWRSVDDEGSQIAAFEYSVPARIWCGIRARFGVWVVCGHVTVCDTKQPVAGVTVKAFDVDWLQDDALGSAVTDAGGHFRIDYLASDFRRTPFSPLINVEWVGGPDLYFRIEAPGGAPLLVEPRSKGRTPGRENVGPCTCVQLCITGDVPGTPPTIPLFTKVGGYRIATPFGEFAADGTTTAGSLAFTGDIPLIGILPDPLSPDSIEYRFLVGPSSGGSTAADASQIAPTVIGELEYFAWDSVLSTWTVQSADFWVNQPGAVVHIPQSGSPDLTVDVSVPIGADGWIPAPRVNQLVPGGHGRFIPNGTLATLRTRKYTDEQADLTTPAPGLQAGDSIPAGAVSTMPTFGITFQARKTVVHTAVGTNSLGKIAFSNVTDTYEVHPYWAGGNRTSTGVASLGIAEMQTAGGCAEMGDEIHLLYTAYHPYVGQPTVYLEGNPILPAPLTPAVSSGSAVSSSAGVAVDISLLAKCAYILWLDVPLRLTSGYGSLGWVLQDHIGFCKK